MFAKQMRYTHLSKRCTTSIRRGFHKRRTPCLCCMNSAGRLILQRVCMPVIAGILLSLFFQVYQLQLTSWLSTASGVSASAGNTIHVSPSTLRGSCGSNIFVFSVIGTVQSTKTSWKMDVAVSKFAGNKVDAPIGSRSGNLVRCFTISLCC